MQLIFTECQEENPKNCYVIKITFEHGDADQYSNEEETLNDFTIEEFKAYHKKFEEVATVIHDNRSSQEALPENFDEFCIFKMNDKEAVIPYEYDGSADMDSYYAKVWIETIAYYDESGNKFDVIVVK